MEAQLGIKIENPTVLGNVRVEDGSCGRARGRAQEQKFKYSGPPPTSVLPATTYSLRQTTLQRPITVPASTIPDSRRESVDIGLYGDAHGRR